MKQLIVIREQFRACLVWLIF